MTTEEPLELQDAPSRERMGDAVAYGLTLITADRAFERLRRASPIRPIFMVAWYHAIDAVPRRRRQGPART